MHYTISAEAQSERILKIGQDLPKLWTTIKWVFFSVHSLVRMCITVIHLLYLSERGNVLGVGNYCYVAVCSATLGASAPTGEERGGGISWWPPAYSLLIYIF